MTQVVVEGGRSHWGHLLRERDGYTFLWQDSDGLHRGPLPSDAPYTSLLHGWSADGMVLVRVRLDGQTVWLAQITPGDGETATVSNLHSWGAKTRRVAGFRSPDDVSLDDRFFQVELLDRGRGALVFYAPDVHRSVWV